jgi:hypothetical protein
MAGNSEMCHRQILDVSKEKTQMIANQNEAGWMTGLINEMLSEISEETKETSVLCAGPEQGTDTSELAGRGFKICKQGESPARTLCVSIDRITSDGSGPRSLKSQLRLHISQFWSSGNSERIIFKNIDF